MTWKEKRRVVQYHYVTWADHSTPKVTDLVDFWRRVRIDYHVMNEHGSPLLVHCRYVDHLVIN